MSQKSHAQSLRVIGHALENLRITVFVLEKQSDNYIVRDWEPSFLTNIAEEVWGLVNSGVASVGKKSSDLLAYNAADTERLESIGQESRESRNSNVMRGRSEISSGLRVVGDYLDRQRAGAFTIWWTTEFVTVKYNSGAGAPKRANFTLQNLTDLKVGMYLRRSNRQP
jgi:hypothetical protein